MAKELYNTEWMSLMSSDDGFIYGHMNKQQDGHGVAVLVYRTDEQGKITHMLGRYERNPAHGDGLVITSITGGIDHGMAADEAVEQELLEEAGIDLKRERGWTMQDLGTCVPSKFLDHVYHLYAINATGMNLGEAPGDGTDGERDAYCKWEYPHVVLGCKCPLVALMAMRAGLLENIA